MSSAVLRARGAAVQDVPASQPAFNGSKTLSEPAAVGGKNSYARRVALVLSDAALLFHLGSLAVYLYVWCWHLTPAAALLPGSTGFGWFFRYLTFYAFTLQVLQLMLCVAAGIVQECKTRTWIAGWADDLSCALFGMAHAVTLMYYIIQSATQDAVEGGHVERPPWLGFAVHVMNTIFAWADLLIAQPRSFSTRAQRWSSIIIIIYATWILICRQVEGFFPYPFLNKLPFPTGFLGIAAASVCVFTLAFHGGRTISTVVRV